MTIKDFIQTQIFLPRLRDHGVLVVYDPDRRYHALCLELATPQLRVIDASESSIESRAAALSAFQELGEPTPSLAGMLVYVPARPPLSDEEKQRDPFALYAACGALFPASDGDEYLNLCLRARADHATAIRRIFSANPNPDFAVIDAVGGGAGWPHLQTLLGVESARDILFALLVPTARQMQALTGQDAWSGEATLLVQTTLGLTLITRAKTWGPVADELWRFLLFSEFVFDLPGDLPAQLAHVPHAPAEARPLVEDVCDWLRNDRRTQAIYVERAETIERELMLPTACQAITDLGVRDTFPFEERTFFSQAVDALLRDHVDTLRQALERHTRSVWVGRGESQIQWQMLQAAMRLVEACADAERQFPDHKRSQDSVIDFYLSSLREVDRLQREFEQTAGDYLVPSSEMDAVTQRARHTYRQLADQVQSVFIRHLAQSGWPPSGRLANADVFDRLVVSRLQESGRRVALLLIDALRYELGVELHKQVAEEGQTDLQAAYASLPSITLVGMASLLPGAGQSLTLTKQDNQVLVTLDDQPLTTVQQRMEVLRKRYGQRFADVGLTEFVRTQHTIADTVELLVIRSNEMDSDFEQNPETAPGLISRTFQRLSAAIRRLRTQGFHEAIIVTDHGFYLNTAAGTGDVCMKPAGTWLSVHGRLLLGAGVSDTANLVLPAAQLGLRGDFAQIALPRALVSYRAGQIYFHGGASLQETVVPVITVRLAAVTESVGAYPSVTIRYKRGARRITTRLPVIEVDVGSGDLFSMHTTIELLLEAHDRQGTVVGEARLGGVVNPATKTLSIPPGTTVQVTLKMDLDFEGTFTVKALDPTTLTTVSTLDLETDYTV